SNQGLTVCWSSEITSVKWPGWRARMCASTSSDAAASAAEVEVTDSDPPPRLLCTNLQDPPTTSKRTAAAASHCQTGEFCGKRSNGAGVDEAALSSLARTFLSKPAGRGSRSPAFCTVERTDSSACKARPQLEQPCRWRPNSAAWGASSSP